MSLENSFAERRLRRHAKLLAVRVAHGLRDFGPDARESAAKLLANVDALEDFCDAAVAEQAALVGGPLMDIIETLIKDFIENPEKWIALIIKIIGLF